jgi:hypothetical protein
MRNQSEQDLPHLIPAEPPAAAARRNWIVVASADHAARGRALGIMQACHGNAAALRRLRAGDRVACYSPTVAFGGSEKCQAFTAIGIVRDELVYQADMGGGFQPFRRAVDWRLCVAAPIQGLRTRLEVTRGKQNWGYAFRFGLIAISEHDMTLIAEAMTSRSAIA